MQLVDGWRYTWRRGGKAEQVQVKGSVLLGGGAGERGGGQGPGGEEAAKPGVTGNLRPPKGVPQPVSRRPHTEACKAPTLPSRGLSHQQSGVIGVALCLAPFFRCNKQTGGTAEDGGKGRLPDTSCRPAPTSSWAAGVPSARAGGASTYLPKNLNVEPTLPGSAPSTVGCSLLSSRPPP